MPTRAGATLAELAASSPVIAALLKLEDSINQRGEWDLPPAIFLWWPSEVLSQLIIPESMWQQTDGHPATVLNIIGEHWAEVSASMAGAHAELFTGAPSAVAMLTETWTVRQDATEADIESAQRAAAKNLLHMHPARVQARLILVATLAGNINLIMRTEGEAEPNCSIADPEGFVPDTMMAFLASINRTTDGGAAAATEEDS